jgi:hypothetical protein
MVMMSKGGAKLFYDDDEGGQSYDVFARFDLDPRLILGRFGLGFRVRVRFRVRIRVRVRVTVRGKD